MNFLQRHHAEILAAWTAEAARAASARGLSEVELKNMMPVCLAAIAEEVDRDELWRHIGGHLADRIRWGFDLGEIVEEFALLERCIMQAVRRAPASERPSEDLLARSFVALQSIMVRTADTFQEHMRLDEQREKRYLRMLRALADQSLRAPQPPLELRLREAMTIIMEATAADSAALMLYEPETHRLVMRAAVGAAESDLQDFVASLDPRSFTGKIAADTEPTEVGDVATTELAVNGALRHSGIHSLLGVRLPRRHSILGVMYIGTRAQRPFPARDVHRLEALGEALTLHLDNARLYAVLRDRIDELQVERALRERFVAVLAHDLRGPLMTAQMTTHVLRRLGERAGQRPELVGRIEHNLGRVDDMVRGLLDVSRVRAGHGLPLHLDWCDLRAIADEVIEDLRETYDARFELVGDAEVRGMWSRDALRRSLWNLAENAVKHGAADHPITLRIDQRPDSARVSVHNAGEPIPAEAQAHLFDAFSQPRPTPGPGWGLGLALVRACAEAHGGSVAVESTREAGTTVAMVLPLDARPHQQGAGASA